MNPSTNQVSMLEYASDNTEYKQSPNEDQTRGGVVPLDTLPAAWWNWLWSMVTKNNNASMMSIADLRTELNNVLVNAGIEASASQSNQILRALLTIVHRAPTFDELGDAIPGTVVSSADANSVSVDDTTGKMVVNALSDWATADGSVKEFIHENGGKAYTSENIDGVSIVNKAAAGEPENKKFQVNALRNYALTSPLADNYNLTEHSSTTFMQHTFTTYISVAYLNIAVERIGIMQGIRLTDLTYTPSGWLVTISADGKKTINVMFNCNGWLVSVTESAKGTSMIDWKAEEQLVQGRVVTGTYPTIILKLPVVAGLTNVLVQASPIATQEYKKRYGSESSLACIGSITQRAAIASDIDLCVWDMTKGVTGGSGGGASHDTMRTIDLSADTLKSYIPPTRITMADSMHTGDSTKYITFFVQLTDEAKQILTAKGTVTCHIDLQCGHNLAERLCTLFSITVDITTGNYNSIITADVRDGFGRPDVSSTVHVWGTDVEDHGTPIQDICGFYVSVMLLTLYWPVRIGAFKQDPFYVSEADASDGNAVTAVSMIASSAWTIKFRVSAFVENVEFRDLGGDWQSIYNLSENGASLKTYEHTEYYWHLPYYACMTIAGEFLEVTPTNNPFHDKVIPAISKAHLDPSLDHCVLNFIGIYQNNTIYCNDVKIGVRPFNTSRVEYTNIDSCQTIFDGCGHSMHSMDLDDTNHIYPFTAINAVLQVKCTIGIEVCFTFTQFSTISYSRPSSITFTSKDQWPTSINFTISHCGTVNIQDAARQYDIRHVNEVSIYSMPRYSRLWDCELMFSQVNRVIWRATEYYGSSDSSTSINVAVSYMADIARCDVQGYLFFAFGASISNTSFYLTTMNNNAYSRLIIKQSGTGNQIQFTNCTFRNNQPVLSAFYYAINGGSPTAPTYGIPKFIGCDMGDFQLHRPAYMYTTTGVMTWAPGTQYNVHQIYKLDLPNGTTITWKRNYTSEVILKACTFTLPLKQIEYTGAFVSVNTSSLDTAAVIMDIYAATSNGTLGFTIAETQGIYVTSVTVSLVMSPFHNANATTVVSSVLYRSGGTSVWTSDGRMLYSKVPVTYSDMRGWSTI